MAKYIQWSGTSLLIALAALTTACADKKADTLAQDSTLGQDISLANRDSAAQPTLNDVPVAANPTTPTTTERTTSTTPRTTTRPAPAPVVHNPAPARTTTPRTGTTASGNTVTRTPSGSAGATVGTIAAGTAINLSSSSRVCTNTNKVGDRVTATVREAVSGSNGVVIPAGATAVLEITQLKRSENVNDAVVLGLRLRSISFGGRTYTPAASVTYAQVDKVKNQPSGKDAQKVATGAAIGAVVGQVLGKNTKSTVIGGAVGAAAGAGAAAATSNYEGCVPDGGRITVTLSSPAQVTG